MPVKSVLRSACVAAFSAIVMCASGTGTAAPAADVESAKIQARDQLQLMLFRIKLFHEEARAAVRATLDLDLFREYFSLPESLKNRYTELGSIELTPRQDRIRQRLESWVLHLHERFPMGETCLVDRYGQEHMRVVRGKVQKSAHFSGEEHGSPFFRPSLDAKAGEVYLSDPYMSSDVYRWVIAFTSPVIIGKGQPPGFYHFELPLEIHQQLVSTVDYAFAVRGASLPDSEEEGRVFILDRGKNLLIADNRQAIDYELKAERHPEKNTELPHYLPPERIEDYLPGPNSISAHSSFLAVVEKMRQGETGVEEIALQDGTYVLAYAPIPGRNWSIGHLDPVGAAAFWEYPDRK